MDTVILVPIRQSASELDSIYTLNETAASAWELMDGEHTLEQICEALVAEYQVDPAEAQDDLFELAAQLCELKVIFVRCLK